MTLHIGTETLDIDTTPNTAGQPPRCAMCRGTISIGEGQTIVDQGLSEFTAVPVGLHLCFWCYHGLADDFDELPQEGRARQ